MTALATEMALTIRRADHGDMEHLLFSLEQFAEFFGSHHSLYPDEETARRILGELLETQPFFVAMDGRAFAGFIGGALAPHPYNPAIRVLSEMFWWVDENWRGTRAGLLLLEEFIRYGVEHADVIHFTLETKSPVNERTLTKRGFTLVERAYIREVIR